MKLNMKPLKNMLILLLAQISLYSFFVKVSFAEDVCAKSVSEFSCLKNNFDVMYASDYRKFWQVANLAAKKAEKCEDMADVSAFFQLAVIKKSGNAEFEEFFSQTVERICVENNECFFSALVKENVQTQSAIVGMLKNPLFQNQKSIYEVFVKNKENKAYKAIIELYFRQAQQVDDSHQGNFWDKLKTFFTFRKKQ